MAMASRTRCSGVPVCRSRRARMRAIAISAAFSPAFCPPIPSTTRKMPRSGSLQKPSSLFWRTKPGSLAAAQCRAVLSIGGLEPAKLQKQNPGQADPRAVRHGSLHIAVALIAVHHFDAGGNRLAVDRGAQAAEVLQIEITARRIAPQPEMLARNIRQSVQLEICPIIASAAPDYDLVLGNPIGPGPGVVLKFNYGISVRLRRCRC